MYSTNFISKYVWIIGAIYIEEKVIDKFPCFTAMLSTLLFVFIITKNSNLWQRKSLLIKTIPVSILSYY